MLLAYCSVQSLPFSGKPLHCVPVGSPLLASTKLVNTNGEQVTLGGHLTQIVGMEPRTQVPVTGRKWTYKYE